MKVKLTEMELVVLIGLVAETNTIQKSEFIKKYNKIKEEHKFSVEEILENVDFKLLYKLNKKYKKMIDKSTK